VGALECLLLYPWTENLRELRAVVSQAAEQSLEFPCAPEHLPLALRNHRGTLRAPSSATQEEPTPLNLPNAASEPPQPELPIPEPTRGEVDEALRQTQGRVRTAAQLLGIERRKLYRLCERFGISLEAYRSDTQREDE
jgi:DNA-binding NtrC family response regulator